MKNKLIYFTAISFFLVINTLRLWEGKLGIYALPFFFLLVLFFLLISIIFLIHLVKLVKEKFEDRGRVILTTFLFTIVITSIIFPYGIINFNQFDSPALLVARKEGAANCTTLLKLKKDDTFIFRSVCFGLSETTGIYSLKGDTIFFEKISLPLGDTSFYQYAIISEDTLHNDEIKLINLFDNKTDLKPNKLWIEENNLIKRNTTHKQINN